MESQINSNINKRVCDVVDFLIKKDEPELEHLLTIFEKQVKGSNDKEVVEKLNETFSDWIYERKRAHGGDMEEIRVHLEELQSSDIIKPYLDHFVRILDALWYNLDTVVEIIKWMGLVLDLEYPADDNEQRRTLKLMLRKKLIDEIQYNSMMEMVCTGLDFDNVISLLKNSFV